MYFNLFYFFKKKLNMLPMGNSHTSPPYPVPSNFFNETGIRIILNKQDMIEMSTIHPQPVSLANLQRQDVFNKRLGKELICNLLNLINLKG